MQLLQDQKDTTISCLMHSITDTQQTIRAYDTKAEILGILLTLAIGITNYTLLSGSQTYSKSIVIIGWLLGLISIVLLGLVLYPKKDPFKKINLGTYIPTGVFYLRDLSTPQNSINYLVDKANNTDWISELMYECMKLSVIRNHKHCLFIWALRTSGITLLFIAISISQSAW